MDRLMQHYDTRVKSEAVRRAIDEALGKTPGPDKDYSVEQLETLKAAGIDWYLDDILLQDFGRSIHDASRFYLMTPDLLKWISHFRHREQLRFRLMYLQPTILIVPAQLDPETRVFRLSKNDAYAVNSLLSDAFSHKRPQFGYSDTDEELHPLSTVPIRIIGWQDVADSQYLSILGDNFVTCNSPPQTMIFSPKGAVVYRADSDHYRGWKSLFEHLCRRRSTRMIDLLDVWLTHGMVAEENLAPPYPDD